MPGAVMLGSSKEACFSKHKIAMDKITMLREILAQNPTDAFARYGLAMEHANQGNTATALQEFQQQIGRASCRERV